MDTQTSTHTCNDFTLIFRDNTLNFNAETKAKMIDCFCSVYPQIVNRFNPNATKIVTFIIQPDHYYSASANGSEITFSGRHLIDHPNDIDVITHELTHVIQLYPGYNPDFNSDKCPKWLVEGIADYVRSTYGISNAGWSLTKYSAEQHYTDSCSVPPFLLWCEASIKETIVDELDATLRRDQYMYDTWKQLTEYTLDDLWVKYTSSAIVLA